MFEKREIKRIQPQLLELKEQMMEIIGMDNKVEAIIRLFQVISTLQDAGGFTKSINKLDGKTKYFCQLKALIILQGHIINAGRYSGMNLAEVGEKVTADNVLFNVDGLWSRTAAFCLARQDDDCWKSVSCQAENFVKSHAYDIIKQIDVLQG